MFLAPRRYLSGLDWLIAALDAGMKRRGAAGNSSQVVLSLDGVPDEKALREGLRDFLGGLPVLGGRPARSWLNLAPYWTIPRNAPPPVLNVGEAGDDPAAALARCANGTFPAEDVHVAFHLLRAAGNRSWLAMTFDHRLLDARGAELLLEGLRLHLEGAGGGFRSGARATEAPAGLTDWAAKFRSGRMVNRRLLALYRTSPRRVSAAAASAGTGFRRLSFDQAKAPEVLGRAERDAGPLMEVAGLLASAVAAVHALFEARGVPGDSYVVPVTVDVRPPDDSEEAVFFNYSSFFFFELRAARAADRAGVVAEVKRQMYVQVQERFPHRLAEGMYPARIFPLGLLGRAFDRYLGAGPSSFSFAYLGKPAVGEGTFLGAPIRDVFHLPLVPAPPGLGIFLNRWGGRLSAAVSFDRGAFSEEEADGLEERLKGELCG